MKALELAQAYLNHEIRSSEDAYESNDAFLEAQQNLHQLAVDISNEPLDDEFLNQADELYCARAEIKELKKEVDSAESNFRYYVEQSNNVNIELESIHRILDNMINPPKRDDADRFPEGTDEWKFTKYSAVERLAIWLSNK